MMQLVVLYSLEDGCLQKGEKLENIGVVLTTYDNAPNA